MLAEIDPQPAPISTPELTPAPASTPSPTPTPSPVYDHVYVNNGKVFVKPDYERICPLTITADSKHDYYIYLQFISEPSYTTEHSKCTSELADGMPPELVSLLFHSDLGFFVRAGKSVDLLVPIGVYEMYIASAPSGSTFYGPEHLFGDFTSCTVAAEELEFYADSTSYVGHTITLEHTYDGNLEEDDVKMSDFPGVED